MSKNNRIQFIFILASFMAFTTLLNGQSKEETDIVRAMKDEIARSIKNLALGDLQKPYFISYTLSDAMILEVDAALGAIITSELNPDMNHNVDVRVGSYFRDNTNFIDLGSIFGGSYYGSSSSVPIDKDYMGIRRAFWMTTDQQYKNAAEVLEAKLSALKQLKQTVEDSVLADYTASKPVQLVLPDRKATLDKEKWENVARQLSAIFSSYPDIFSSGVSVVVISSNVYYTNTEGTVVKTPVTLASIRINAVTQAEDGEGLHDHLLYYAASPDELPANDKLQSEIRTMAENLVKLRKAPVFDDSYAGPVLFEDQAAMEMFSQELFSGKSNLCSSRKPVFSDPKMAGIMSMMGGESLENKIDKKVVSDKFSVMSKPKMKKYGSVNLIGSYEVDAEGVVPPNELVLIDKGVLKTLLSDRVPTSKIGQSNGSSRFILASTKIEADNGPGVIEINYDGTVKKNELKKLLIEKAREEGLEYAIIVRKLKSTNSGLSEKFDPSAVASLFSGGNKEKGSLTKPIYIYKVSVKDGSETLVRSASVTGISLASLKKVGAVSSEKSVYNTLLTPNARGFGGLLSISIGGLAGGLTGNPASFIAPNGIIVDELEVQKDKSMMTMKLPAVSSPVGQK